MVAIRSIQRLVVLAAAGLPFAAETAALLVVPKAIAAGKGKGKGPAPPAKVLKAPLKPAPKAKGKAGLLAKAGPKAAAKAAPKAGPKAAAAGGKCPGGPPAGGADVNAQYHTWANITHHYGGNTGQAPPYKAQKTPEAKCLYVKMAICARLNKDMWSANMATFKDDKGHLQAYNVYMTQFNTELKCATPKSFSSHLSQVKGACNLKTAPAPGAKAKAFWAPKERTAAAKLCGVPMK